MFEAFFLVGLTIIVGYAALLIADRYRISYVLILMLFGFVLGPVLHLVDSAEGSIMRSIYPFMASLALIILLFDGGLSFNIFNVFKTLSRSTLFTFSAFLLNMLFGLVLVFFAGFGVLEALIIGTLLAGTSSEIVIAMTDKTRANQETRSLLRLESVLTDSLVIIVVFVLIQAAKTIDFSVAAFANSLLGSFSISIILGALAAFAWNFLLQKTVRHALDYMLTVAALFIIYSLVEAVNANGALAVFVFGLTFGNLKAIPVSFLSFSKYSMDEKIRDFQTEVTFFIRTFFFTYVGLLFPLERMSVETLAVSLLIVSVFTIARYGAARLILGKDSDYDFSFIVSMLPRGLAPAVVIGVLISNGVVIAHLEEIVFTVIFLTNIIATVAVYAYHNGKKKDAEVPEDDGGAAAEARQEEPKEDAAEEEEKTGEEDGERNGKRKLAQD